MSAINTPFPGKPAQFLQHSGNWNTIDPEGCPMVRSLEFSSLTQDSFFTDVKVLGYGDGRIAFAVFFQCINEKETKSYFKQHGLKQANVKLGLCNALTVEERKKLFAILNENNKIPENKFELMRQLSEAKNWHDITPLKS